MFLRGVRAQRLATTDFRRTDIKKKRCCTYSVDAHTSMHTHTLVRHPEGSGVCDRLVGLAPWC